VLGPRTAPVITFTAPAILVQLVDLVCMLLLDAVTMVSSITPVSAVGHVWSKIVLESNVRFRISWCRVRSRCQSRTDKQVVMNKEPLIGGPG